MSTHMNECVCKTFLNNPGKGPGKQIVTNVGTEVKFTIVIIYYIRHPMYTFFPQYISNNKENFCSKNNF